MSYCQEHQAGFLGNNLANEIFLGLRLPKIRSSRLVTPDTPVFLELLELALLCQWMPTIDLKTLTFQDQNIFNNLCNLILLLLKHTPIRA